MKIEKVEIVKFRSIEHGYFLFNGIAAIVGQNNSGKSAIMRALNSFFNPKHELPHYISGTNLYTSKRAIPKIRITFNSIPDKQIYQPFVSEGKIIVEQKFDKKRNHLVYLVLCNGKFELAEESFVSELLNDVQFVLIPTERSLRNRSNGEFSVLKKLLDTFFAAYTSKRDTLTPKVKDLYNYLKKNVLSKISKGIEEKYLVSKPFKITLDNKSTLNYEIFINELVIKIIEEDKKFKLEECGSGIQSLVIISIYRYLAALNNTNYIFGIEEPEISLHPQAQKELVYALKDEVNSNNVQIVFTTHSTVLVDELDHTKIVLVRKVPDEKRKFKSTLHQLDNNFWEKYNIQVFQYDKFHKFRNSEFFFANHVIVTESPIDSEVFRNLLKNKGIIIEKSGISILELSGIKSLKYAFYLLRDLKIPKTMIIDKDFFFAYCEENDKKKSRYKNGFFKYTSNFRNDSLINDIFSNPNKRKQIEKLLSSNHSRALDETLKFDVLCMKWNLEMDLVASRTAQTLFYNKLSIPEKDRNTYNLLVNYEKKIKKLDVLLYVINKLPHKNLPNSYKRLIKRFRKMKI